MRLRLIATIKKQSNLEEIEVPFFYTDHKDREVESHAKVTLDPESKTYEIDRIYPSDIDDEWPRAEVRDWMKENYPEYEEVK